MTDQRRQSQSPAASPMMWVVIAGVWPLVCSLAAVLWSQYQANELRAELAARPLVAVLPVDDLVLADIAKRQSADPAPSVRLVREMADRLAGAGYIVLDQSTVFAAPEVFVARPSEDRR